MYLSEGSMARLDPARDDQHTKGGGASEDRPAGVLSDARDTRRWDHDGSLISHHSRGHGRLRARDGGPDDQDILETPDRGRLHWGPTAVGAPLAGSARSRRSECPAPSPV